MSAFSYLSVLLSIVLGLAITQVLQGYRALLLARGRIGWSAPPLIWSAMILLFAAQSWWASFGLENHRSWTFGAFLVILLQMALLYLMAAVVLPDVPDGEPIDLGDHYREHRRPFFVCLGAITAVSIAKDLMLDGRLPSPENLIFHALLTASAVIGAVARRDRVHLALAIMAPIAFAGYVWLLFSRL